MQFSVVIPTYNRAAELKQTLASLAQIDRPGSWEVLVVDNNSTDTTPQVVAESRVKFPTALRYLFEPQVGRSAALNAGIKAAAGEIIANTDDDVRFEPDWLQQAKLALGREQCDFVGGKVLPIWSGPKPTWLSEKGGRHWAVIALLDYGVEPVEFGQRYAPLGVNLAFKREAFDRAGLWDPNLGRKVGTLLGQEVREWMLRARAAGLRGMYAPGMVVHHVIPADRLHKRYFRKWSYWHGISRAMLYQQHPIDMQAPEETRIDFSKVRTVLGVPRYMYRSCLQSSRAMIEARLNDWQAAAFEHELELWFFLGVLRQRLKDRNKAS
ncbi:MAG TPA: glycosyltransferase [Terriglobales bacterium]|jgi:glycosyltransferase involved in cell wall biosynthesis|nr:glycosyltransferase [Terriglobales bacterium]